MHIWLDRKYLKYAGYLNWWCCSKFQIKENYFVLYLNFITFSFGFLLHEFLLFLGPVDVPILHQYKQCYN